MPDIDFKDVHRNSPICFSRECPSCGGCLRYLAGQQSPETLRYHLCVLPLTMEGKPVAGLEGQDGLFASAVTDKDKGEVMPLSRDVSVMCSP